MTDLQDMILDNLVGTRVGVNWPDGPLAIAAAVVGGTRPVKFGQTDNDRGAKAEIARRLGYPVILCEAIQGANRGLKAEDDRRSLAMAVFRTVPIGGAIPKLSSQTQTRIATRLAIRAHPFVCLDAHCPVPRALAELLDAPSINRSLLVKAGQQRCLTANRTGQGAGPGWLTARSERDRRLAQTASMALRGFQSGKSVHGWCSIRESARLAASERGLEEAIACCIEIARQCGIAV
jgi:hypothetical protein